MEILLLILKIIGIVLLVLVSLLLILVFAVLCVPVRYRIRGRAEGFSGLEGSAVFSWLAHLVHVKISYETGEWRTNVRILGISVRLKLPEYGGAQAEEERPVDDNGATWKEDVEETLPARESIPEKMDSEKEYIPEQTGRGQSKNDSKDGDFSSGEQEAITPEMKEKLRQLLDADTTLISDEKGEGEKENRQQSGDNLKTEHISHKKKKKRKNIIQRLQRKLQGFWKKMKQLWKKIRQLIESAAKSKEEGGGIFTKVKNFLREESNKTAVGNLFQEFRYLMRHFSPEKVSGTIAFGLEDPALTGQILAVLSMLGVWSWGKISVEPDFSCQEAFVRGDIMLKGHIRAFHFVMASVRVLKNKNIRSLIKQVKN